MSNRPRRRDRDGRRLVPLEDHGPAGMACGCSHLGVIDIDAVCGCCGERVRDRLVLPTAGQPGDTREVGTSCSCGGHAVGTGVVVEVLPG